MADNAGSEPPLIADEGVEDGGPPTRSVRLFGWFRRFAKLWGFALFCLFVVYLFRDVALPFVFAMLVAYILAPLVDRMARFKVAGRTIPRGLAVVFLYINILLGLGLFIGYFIPKLSADIARVFREAPALFDKLNREYLPRVGGWIDERFGAEPLPAQGPTEVAPVSDHPYGLVLEPLGNGRYRVDLDSLQLEVRPAREGGGYLVSPPRPLEREINGEGRWERSLKDWIADRVKTTESQSRRALEFGQRFVTGVISGIARLILVLMVAAFILIDLQRIRGFIRSLVPVAYRPDYDHLARGIDRGLSGVVRGQLLICLINGVFTYVGLLIFQVKYPLLLAGIAAVMSLIPIFGSILSSIPIVFIALVSSSGGGGFDLVQGVKVTGWIAFIHLVEANFLNPKIMGDAAKIHPVVVVFALIAGEHSYGIVGALFAVPVASIIQTLFLYFRRRERWHLTTGAE